VLDLIRSLAARRCALNGALLAAALGGTLAGCGGGSSDNGVASKSAAEIFASSQAAARSATSVHVTGRTGRGAQSTVNLDLSRAAGSAQVSLAENTFELIRTGQTLYVKGSPALYQQLGAAVNVPAGTWLRVPVGDPQLGGLAAFTELAPEIERLIKSSSRTSKGPTTTVDGQKVIELRQQAARYSYVTSVYVATKGKPYPVQIVTRGQISGQTTFSGWNKSLSVTPPPKALDIGQLQHAGG
jgi:hypothetical protein